MDEMVKDKAFVRPDVRAVLDMMAAMDSPDISEVNADEARELYRITCQMAAVDRAELPEIRDITCLGAMGELPARLYEPREKTGDTPVIAFFHGGGFVIGDLDTHDGFCSHLAKAVGIPVISVDYRMAPELVFPAAQEDCIAAARWMTEAEDVLGFKVTGLVPCGESAGGNLTIATTHALLKNPAKAPVIAQMPIYPVVGSAEDWPSMTEFADGYFLTMDQMHWFMGHFQPQSGHEHIELIDNAPANTPPTVLVTASLDPLRDQGRAYGAKLIEMGVDVSFYEAKGTVHNFINMGKAMPSTVHDFNSMFGRLKGVIAGAMR